MNLAWSLVYMFIYSISMYFCKYQQQIEIKFKK